MKTATSKRDEILEVAERMIRVAGYNGFRTRDIADAVGIKKARGHDHFPGKSEIWMAFMGR